MKGSGLLMGSEGGSISPQLHALNYWAVLLHLGCHQLQPLSYLGKENPKGKMTHGTHPTGLESDAVFEMQRSTEQR